MGIPLGIMASGHQLATAGLTMSFNTRTYQEDPSGASNAGQDATNTMTTSLSAGSVGDIAILWERRINSASSVVPTQNLNSGWTLIGSYSVDANREFREDFSYKIMTSSDISSGTVTTGQAEWLQNTILFFTPSQTIQSTQVNGFSNNADSGEISGQTQRPETQSDNPPVIIIYTKTTHQPNSDSVDCAIGGTAGTAIGSNSFFEQLTGTNFKTRDDDSRIGFIIQNSTLQNVQSDPVDEGSRQTATDFHLEFT
tara:strand:- start:641 stop:1402 length:762 start_codon:yes stop_codon:yes gene_type:complete